jgi:hypothetical protein
MCVREYLIIPARPGNSPLARSRRCGVAISGSRIQEPDVYTRAKRVTFEEWYSAILTTNFSWNAREKQFIQTLKGASPQAHPRRSGDPHIAMGRLNLFGPWIKPICNFCTFSKWFRSIFYQFFMSESEFYFCGLIMTNTLKNYSCQWICPIPCRK